MGHCLSHSRSPQAPRAYTNAPNQAERRAQLKIRATPSQPTLTPIEPTLTPTEPRVMPTHLSATPIQPRVTPTRPSDMPTHLSAQSMQTRLTTKQPCTLPVSLVPCKLLKTADECLALMKTTITVMLIIPCVTCVKDHGGHNQKLFEHLMRAKGVPRDVEFVRVDIGTHCSLSATVDVTATPQSLQFSVADARLQLRDLLPAGTVHELEKKFTASLCLSVPGQPLTAVLCDFSQDTLARWEESNVIQLYSRELVEHLKSCIKRKDAAKQRH